MNELCRMRIGLQDLILELKECSHQTNLPGKLSISFALEGNFFKAAQSDNLNDTLDYAVISAELRAFAKKYRCNDSELVERMKSTLENYSSMISGVFITGKPLCHAPFLSQKTLL